MPGPRASQTGDVITEKVDAAGRRVRQIELCNPHLDFVIERERGRGLEVQDRRKRRAQLYDLR